MAQDVESRGVCVYVGAGGICGCPILAAQFGCEPETALKISLLTFKKYMHVILCNIHILLRAICHFQLLMLHIV